MRDRAPGRRGGRIICFGRGEFFLKRERRGRIEAWRGRLRRGLSISPPEPVSLAARTSRSTVTLLSAARDLCGRRRQPPRSAQRDRRRFRRRRPSRRPSAAGRPRERLSPNEPLSTAAAATAAAAADLAFFQRGAVSVVAQERGLFVLLAAGFKGLSSSASTGAAPR